MTKSAQTTNRTVFILSIIGILIASYVTQSFLRRAPIVCVNTGCELVRKSPLAYILGIPVPAFGLVGYALLALFALIRTNSQKTWQIRAMLAIALFGVTFVSWFTYTEIFKIKALCTWCAISGVNMAVILMILIKSYSLEKNS